MNSYCYLSIDDWGEASDIPQTLVMFGDQVVQFGRAVMVFS